MKRRSCIGIWIAIVFLFVPTSMYAEEGTRWLPGSVDLTTIDFNKRVTVSLDGDWEFYWSQLLTPASFQDQKAELRSDSIPVPATWGGLSWRNETLSNVGFGTYRLTFQLSELSAKRMMALQLRSVATAYSVWVNGELLAENGKVGTDKSSMEPKNVPRILYFQPHTGRNEIVIQVSNFVQRKGGIWEGLSLGNTEAISEAGHQRIITEAFMIGCLTMMGFYHLSIFVFRKKDKKPLYLGIVCLAVSLRTWVLGETLGIVLLPSFPWEIAVKIEYISASAGLLAFVYFIGAQYSSRITWYFNRVFTCLQAVVIGIVLFTRAKLYTQLMLPIELFVIVPSIIYIMTVYIWAAFHRQEGSVINMIGFTVMAGVIVNDMLFYNQIISSGPWLPLGLLFFLLMQSILVSVTYSRAFHTSELLSEKLKHVNMTLERKVSERTIALADMNARLEGANRELKRSEQFRKLLLANISHELRTPLTAIKGFASAIMDGVITRDYNAYARRIFDKTLFLGRVIDDLIDLTKLETRQMSLQFEEHAALPLLRRWFDKYETEWSLDDSFCMTWDESEAVIAQQEEVVIYADSFRLEQVFSNVLSNARKYAGGMAHVSVQLVRGAKEEEAELCVKVIDHGPGIPEEEVPLIFDRFYRSKSVRSAKQEGTGLGLAICKEIMAHHQGSIDFSRGTDASNIFSFRLPARLIKKEMGGASD
ncbi:ATP-binding protein [Marinicrinis lubricantis]|uniref:histidine kinase n=1 Tax=Marinicrinis lubricantis TaxID=2086470 RepID=A0ABW1ISZ7_9BACL